MALLPLFLLVFMGQELVDVVEAGPFLKAFAFLIVTPLALAWASEVWAARRTAGQRFSDAASTTMVPLMAAALLVVVASQTPKLDGRLGDLAAVVPFLRGVPRRDALRRSPGGAAVRSRRPGLSGRRVHRSHPQLPRGAPARLALADQLAIAAAVVVTQTLVEVIGMVAYVKAVPRLIPDRAAPTGAARGR